MAKIHSYQTSLRVAGRPVLVVGGGYVAAHHAQLMLDAGAQVRLVAPVLSIPARALADAGLVRWQARNYLSSDLDDVWYAVAATGDPAVDARVADDAEANRIWCEAPLVDMDPLAGRHPLVELGETAGPDLEGLDLDKLTQRNLDLAPQPLPLFASSHLVPRGRGPRLDQRRGHVALVGGGPGAEDLITVRGLRLLRGADVVVADRLGPRGLLNQLGEHVKVIEVGKTPGHHPVPQTEINAILVREAKAGKRVVRLKGGDPYVLGRGGEEAIACRENDVDVEVVPGVTSAVSVPAAAGIPVTHRGLAKAFTMISGHEELENVPHGSDHTVILLMGVGTLNRSIPILAAAGRGRDCPVAIIENGFAKDQRVTIGTLGTIVAAAQARQVRNPAVVVVGDVVRVSPLAPADLATANYGTRETISTLS